MSNRFPSDPLVNEFRDAITSYAAAHPNMSLHLLALDILDLKDILDTFEAGDQVAACTMVYRLFRVPRSIIPENVLRFIFEHGSN